MWETSCTHVEIIEVMLFHTELSHDIIFKDRVATHHSLKEEGATKVFGEITSMKRLKPFQIMMNQLYDLYNELGSDNFKLEAQMVEDVKSISSFETKHMNMPVQSVTVRDRSENATSLS